MGKVVIRAEGVSKRYSRGGIAVPHPARQSAVFLARRVKRFLRGQLPPERPVIGGAGQDEFFALKDVSFEIREGERVGVIGRNGAGKSTLLKILSRITKPTTGSIDIYGRLGALLEVGTGFHPELSGRENIYLNAAVLGLKRAEVARRFDEIVAFAEVEDFLDLPVKHYSSGMFMRLAFSVSAHLDPDILILDEVLAVGDAGFQKKCLGKMEGVAKDGRTILFVSHNISSIISFCDRCLLLDHGHLLRDAGTIEVTEYYQESLTANSEKSPEVIIAERNKTSKATFSSIKITPLGHDGQPCQVMRVGQDVEIETVIRAHKQIKDNDVAIVISTGDGNQVINASLLLKSDYLNLAEGEEALIRFTLRNVLLRPGNYRVGLWAGRRPFESTDMVLEAATLCVELAPRSVQNPQVLEGLYQCEFTHTTTIRPT